MFGNHDGPMMTHAKRDAETYSYFGHRFSSVLENQNINSKSKSIKSPPPQVMDLNVTDRGMIYEHHAIEY